LATSVREALVFRIEVQDSSRSVTDSESRYSAGKSEAYAACQDVT